jgi:N-hydroxyarylamine O-acetyltransferase
VFGAGVPHDQLIAVEKIVSDQSTGSRGGWCFELNGALALLLEALGYHVRLLGAAVLHDGPTQVIEHLLLEVESPRLPPHLVDVGFGDSFDLPLALNAAGPQDGGSGEFELIGSPQGTTVTRHVDGVPVALLRFKRVAHAFEDFAPVSTSMQIDPTKKWATHPFATRRLTDDEQADDPGPPTSRQRVTLTKDRLKLQRGEVVNEQPVERNRWDRELDTWFKMTPPGPWPTEF